ncbi:hypothetical protein SALBM311S_10416 [Streptomyces alboniger]
MLPPQFSPSLPAGRALPGDRLIRLTAAEVQEKMRTLNNDTPGTEGTGR